MTDFFEIRRVRVYQEQYPEVYTRLCKMDLEQIEMVVLDALFQVLVVDIENQGSILSTIFSDTQAIRSKLEGQVTSDQSLPEDVENEKSTDIFGTFTLPSVCVDRSTRPALHTYLLRQARVMGMEIEEVTEYVLNALERSIAVDAQNRDEYTLLAILAEIRALREEDT